MSTIKINFDSVGIPETPTLVLARKNGTKIGGLNAEGVVIKDCFQDPCEITFTLHEETCSIWSDVVDFKLIWCKEWDKWFEINSVEIDESDSKVKNVGCMELSQSELSQIMLFNIEINTEDDIAREDYTSPTIIYDSRHPENSLLNRIMEKAVNFRILHVDDSIAELQRTFKFDDVSLYDAFGKIAEEVDCIFVYENNTRNDGTINRGISVYDMQDSCSNCGHRGYDFVNGICPECGSSGTLVNLRYGKDTAVFITADELGESIKLSSNTDDVKNCFKLSAGDDLMTATIRNCNANGTDYLWYLDNCAQSDMSEELKDKIENYQAKEKEWNEEHEYSGSGWQDNYNYVVSKFRTYDPDIPTIPSIVKGYPMLIETYYNAIDFYYFINTSLLPNVDISKPDADTALGQMTAISSVSVDVTDLEHLSDMTAKNAIENCAKYHIDPRYKAEVTKDSYTYDSSNNKWTWRGTFKVIDISDDTNYATSGTQTVEINNYYETFLKNKMYGVVNEHQITDPDVTSLFEMAENPVYYNDPFVLPLGDYTHPDADTFINRIKWYSIDELGNLQKICQSCIDIMIEQDIPATRDDEFQVTSLFYRLYVPYKHRLGAIETELKEKEGYLSVVQKTLDTIQMYINTTHDVLDFQKFLGEDLWKEFVLYKREQRYSNENYVSDGLENSELIEKANEFIKTAQKELYKSATLQHSISTSLKNLLAIERFQPIIDKFKVGNWIRIKADNDIYRLRLLSYEIDYDNLENLSVEFSDVLKTLDGEVDQQSIIDKMTSISTSYNYTQYQAEKGLESKDVVDGWNDNGINVGNVQIINDADNQCQTWDENGMLFKRFDPDEGKYDKRQLKIINSTMSFTDDDWQNCKTAVGFFRYKDPSTGNDETAYGINAESIVGNIIIGKRLGIYSGDGKMTFDTNGLVVLSEDNKNGIYITPKGETLFSIKSNNNTVLGFNNQGNLTITGDITAHDLNFSDDAFKGKYLIVDNDGSVNPTDITTVPNADNVKVYSLGTTGDYPIALVGNGDAYYALGKSSTFTYNPITDTLTISNINGNASTANTANYANNATNVSVGSAIDDKDYKITFADASSGSAVGLKSNSDLTYNPLKGMITMTGSSTSASYTDKGASNVKVSLNTFSSNSDYLPIVCLNNPGGYTSGDDNDHYDDLITTNDIGIYKYNGKAILNLTNGAKIESDDTANVVFVGKASKAETADNADYVKFGSYSVGDYSIPLFYNTTSTYKQFGKDSNDNLKYNPSTKTLSIDSGNGVINAKATSADVADSASTADSADVAVKSKATRVSSDGNYPIALINDTNPYSSSSATTEESIAYGFRNSTYGVTYNPYSYTLTVYGGNGTVNAKATSADTADNATNATNADYVQFGSYSSNYDYSIPLYYNTSSEYKQFGKDSNDNLKYNPSTKNLTINSGSGTVKANLEGNATTASKASAVVDYTSTNSTVQVGYSGASVEPANASYVAVYTSGAHIKDMTFGSLATKLADQNIRPIIYSTSEPGSSLATGTVWLQYEE